MSKTLELTQKMAAAEQAARPASPPPLTLEELMARKGYEPDGVTPLAAKVAARAVSMAELNMVPAGTSKSRARREKIQRMRPIELVTSMDAIGIADPKPIVDDGDAMKTPGPEHDDHDEE